MIKVITGIRRCGKSYFLDPLYNKYLLEDGVPEDHIIKIEFDRAINRKYHSDSEMLERDIVIASVISLGKKSVKKAFGITLCIIGFVTAYFTDINIILIVVFAIVCGIIKMKVEGK